MSYIDDKTHEIISKPFTHEILSERVYYFHDRIVSVISTSDLDLDKHSRKKLSFTSFDVEETGIYLYSTNTIVKKEIDDEIEYCT